MDQIIQSVEDLKGSGIAPLIEQRVNEFEQAGRKRDTVIFQELCFCLLAANCNAQRTIEVEKAVGEGFLRLSRTELRKRLKQLGYRFHTTRADYIWEARKHKDSIREMVYACGDGRKARQWLVENVRGLGYKEASHFLRNVGFKDVAIIDFHIVEILVRHGLTMRPKTMTKNKYLKLEYLLQSMAEKLNVTLAELDLYLWYLETGKVLK
ncbi:N-glycosylase/DNA lyase [[Eubacterium] cellulosolvens]